jgi:hypothetical protein
MINLVWIWLAACITLVLLTRRSSAGLPLAYFLGVSLIHVPGAWLHLNAGERDWTFVGFKQTVIGMIAFVAAAMIARFAAFVNSPIRKSAGEDLRDLTDQALTGLDRLALLYVFVGGVAYFVVMPLLGAVASLTAIVSSLGALIMVGACLRLWVARESRNTVKFWSTIALLPVLPLATLIQAGFLGYGSYWLMAIMSFLFAQSKRRGSYVLFAPAVVFIGLSIFVNYMASRGDIRQLVWYEHAGLSDRIQRVEEIFENFEWLDVSDLKHQRAIDGRLNQNWLIGAAAARLDSGWGQYARGSTVIDMVLSLIPRALWPDKPVVGGSGNIVRDYTGIRFAEGTSVGPGQVFEFYVNFGTLGVICGFVLYGLLLSQVDSLIIRYLKQGDQKRFAFWFLIGLALLQPGGNLLEITVSAAGSAIVAYALGRLLNRRSWGRKWSGGPDYQTTASALNKRSRSHGHWSLE